MRRLVVIGVAALALAGCGGSAAAATANPQAQAKLMRIYELAAGKLDALPSGNQFVRVQLFRQQPGAVIASKKHQVGIIYQQSGTQVLQYGDGTHQEITAGTGVFLQSVLHSHTNDGSAVNAWYNLSLWSSLQRATPLTQVVFETEDIPATDFPSQAYTISLRRVTLGQGGRSYAHRFSGVEALFVLEGSLTVKKHGQDAVQLSAGQGTYVPPGVVSQELAAGGAVSYLAFFVTPQGQAFETLVSTPP
jgi:quercetin dioxygenase-like cupin family protein